MTTTRKAFLGKSSQQNSITLGAYKPPRARIDHFAIPTRAIGATAQGRRSHSSSTTPASVPRLQRHQKMPIMAVFNAQKHKTYWLRCLKTFLPWQYTSMDTNRIMLAFFTISALDILDVLDTSVSHGERAEYINWIYSLQHSDGGFRGSPSLSLDGLKDEEQRRKWDRASIPATYFALATLLILRDDFSRVKRDITLKWVKKMQRSDGSFGERLGSNDEVDGGHDTRFGYVAMGIRWMLAGDRSSCKDGDNDVNTDALVKNIGALQTYDGGFADLPFHEAHGGYTYCAVSALAILGRLHDGVAERESLVRWLVARQTRNLDPEDESEEDLTARFASSEPIGFNGRCNKIGDTCYTFWVAGALKVCFPSPRDWTS